MKLIANILLLWGKTIPNSSLRRLNVFRTVVDCGGVNAAAEHLGISQPSVTAHLRALEAQLGSTLFMRSRGRRNVITPTGEALYKYADEALAKSLEFQATVKRFDPAAAQTLSIVIQQALAN
jgi:DNA-binding transcriptional LysR family regulator